MGLDAAQIDHWPDRLTFGNGGWVRASFMGGAVQAFARFELMGDRLEIVEQYANRVDGGPMRSAERKALQWGVLVTLCNRRERKSFIVQTLGFAGPDLRRAAAAFSTNYSDHLPDGRSSHWLRDMIRAQRPGGPQQAPWPGRRPGGALAPAPGGRPSRRHEVDPWNVEPPSAVVDRPDSAPYPTSFYQEVADAYARLRAAGIAPNVAIARENRVPKTTADRWVRRARQLGLLDPAPRGNPAGSW